MSGKLLGSNVPGTIGLSGAGGVAIICSPAISLSSCVTHVCSVWVTGLVVAGSLIVSLPLCVQAVKRFFRLVKKVILSCSPVMVATVVERSL